MYNNECAGCGKTALTSELARLTGNLDMVRVHVDDQMDSKSLLGAYVCTSNPEEFIWQPGPLTQVACCCWTTPLFFKRSREYATKTCPKIGTQESQLGNEAGEGLCCC